MEWFVGIAALLVVWWLWSRRRGNLPFWKLVARHPDEAYQYFLKEDCWFVDELPTNIDKADLTGPFQLLVPSLGEKRVKVYGLAKDLDDSQEAFRSWLAAQSTDDQKTEMTREFYELLDWYTGLPEMDQARVAIALQDLWTAMIVEFGSPEDFAAGERDRQMNYLGKMADLERQASLDGKIHIERAAGFLKMFMAPVIAGDKDLAAEIAKEIEPINRLGWELLQEKPEQG